MKEYEEEVKVRVKVYLDDIHNEYISDVVMAKIDHCFMEIEKKDSSCTENGWEMYSECKYCGLKKGYVEIKATGHKFGETLLYDENTHWKECTCGEKENILEHVEDSGETILEPTEDGTGIKAYKCKECHYIMRTESIDKIIVNDSNIKEE